MTNNCSTARTLEVPLPVDSAGGKTISITGRNVGGLSCRGAGVDKLVSMFWFSNVLGIPGYGPTAAYSEIMLAPAPYVPPSGYLYVTCQVGPGSTIARVEYNP